MNFAANSTIGKDSLFKGHCAVQGNLRVDGRYVGTLLRVEQLYVGPTGRIETDVVANTIVVEGVVIGNINASSRVLLLSSARVMGDLVTPELIVQNGVILDGNCSIGQVHGEEARRLIRDLYDRERELE